MSDMSIEHAPAEVHADHGHGHDDSARVDNLKFATWLYLASEVVIFSILIGTYVIFRQNNPEVVHEVHAAVSNLLVSINTFILLASSWAMVMGLRQLRMGNTQGMVRWIGLTAVLGTIFVGLQYVEYQELAHAGIALFDINNQFDGFGMRFYAPTAFHGAHVIIGVLWALYIVRGGLKGNYSKDNYIGVEIFGLYWHFVDVVWLFLFTLIYLV